MPDGISHPSVGTERDIAEREEARKSLQALRLSRSQLQSLVLSVEDMQKWGYIVAAPEAPGGTEPAIEGKIAKCERCVQYFQVKRREEAGECVHHWGRPYTKMIEGKFCVSCLQVTGSDVILQANGRGYILAAQALRAMVEDASRALTSSMNPMPRRCMHDMHSRPLDHQQSLIRLLTWSHWTVRWFTRQAVFGVRESLLSTALVKRSLMSLFGWMMALR